MIERYRIEQLPNGLLLVFDRVAKLAACYDTHGRHVAGDLRLTSSVLTELTTEEKGIEQMEETNGLAKLRLYGHRRRHSAVWPASAGLRLATVRYRARAALTSRAAPQRAGLRYRR
jgi:hypothetical protein